MRIFKVLCFTLLVGCALFLSGQQPVVRQLQCTSGASSGTTYACSIASVPSGFALVTSTTYWFLADVDNTGAATVNFNTLGAKSIKKMTGASTTALVAGDIRANEWVQVLWDGTNM